MTQHVATQADLLELLDILRGVVGTIGEQVADMDERLTALETKVSDLQVLIDGEKIRAAN